jgi:ABC-type Fe3+ transport system substrate-binding protein
MREDGMTGLKQFILKLVAIGAVVGLTQPSQAQQIQRTPALEKLIKDAQAEKELNLSWGHSLGAATGAKLLQDAMNKEFGTSIKVTYTPGPAMPQLASRIIQEIEAGKKPTSDLVLGAETTFTQLLRAKALQPIAWTDYFKNITPDMQTKDGTAVHIVTLVTGIHYNTELIKPNEVPRKLADIFNPKWKGKIAGTIYAAGFDRLALRRGLDVMRPIVQKTGEWSGGLIRCGENERIASGEFVMLFMDCGKTDDRLMVEKGGPLNQVVIEDAALTTNWYWGVPKGIDKINAAILFAGFVASPPGQKVIDETAGASSHFVPGTSAFKKVKELQERGAEILTQTPDELLEREADLDKFRNEFQQLLRQK